MTPRRILALIFLATALAYLPALTSGLVRDDWVLILRARSVSIEQELNPFFPGHVEHLRPARKMLYKGMNAVFGTNPLPYHVLNLMLHLACVAMFYRMARGYGRGYALSAAALFALHPALSEAVIWPAAVATPLSTLFALGALQTHTGEKSATRLISIALAVAAYLTHESTAPLAAVMVLMAWSEKRLRERRKILTAHVSAAAIFIAIWMAGPLVFNRPVATGGWRLGAHGLFHIVEYVVSLTLYPGLFLFPHGAGWLGFLRERLWLHVAADLLFAAAIALWVAKSPRRESAWLASAMVLLLPVSFFVWGNSSRYLHFPAMFWTLIAVSVGRRVYEKSGRKNAWRAAFMALLIIFAVNDFSESMGFHKEAVETNEALVRIEAAMPAGARSLELPTCPMHPDHLAAALRVIKNDVYFQIVCRKIEKLPHAPPRIE